MNEAFSKTLKKLRTERELSQQALADKMFVTRPTVVRWESEARLPDAFGKGHFLDARPYFCETVNRE